MATSVLSQDKALSERDERLLEIQERVLWLAMQMIHHANHVRPSRDGLKVGGHQASSASLVNSAARIR